MNEFALALLFIDLDKFKTINDTLGHAMGDLLLQQVAQRLTSCVREGDTVARVGGDEFVLLLPDLNQDLPDASAQTEAIGKKIHTSLNTPYQLAQHTLTNTPSIGATLFNDRQNTSEELIKRADLAMYQAKASGRNTMLFFLIRPRRSLAGEMIKVENNQNQGTSHSGIG